jgi:hypothetical protein
MKNWPNESNANCKPILDLKKYLKKKDFLAKENYKNFFFWKSYKLIMTYCGARVYVGCGWGKELALQLSIVFHKIGVQFPCK